MSMITPGPWEQNGEAVDAENNSVLNIAVCNMARVANGWSGTDYTTQEHQIANARLIAAAPDLLAALQAAVECHMVPISSAREGGAVAFSIQTRVADQIRYAIAKATEVSL